MHAGNNRKNYGSALPPGDFEHAIGAKRAFGRSEGQVGWPIVALALCIELAASGMEVQTCR